MTVLFTTYGSLNLV